MKLVVLVNGQRWEQTKYSKMALLTEFVASSMAQEMFTTLWKEKLTLSDENKWIYCKVRSLLLTYRKISKFSKRWRRLKHFACLFLCSLRSQDTAHRPDREGGTVFVKSSGSPQDVAPHTTHTTPTATTQQKSPGEVTWIDDLGLWTPKLQNSRLKKLNEA